MSTTTTTTTTTTKAGSDDVARLLVDYKLHHSGQVADEAQEQTAQQETQGATSNPDGWPSDYRSMPDFRPARRRNLSEYPAGNGAVEGTIVLLVMNGAGLLGTASRFWRSTIGRFDESMFRYAIGGES